jgi:probable phosphomutase (TIGR03848 family)
MTTLLLIRHGENDYTATGRLAGRLPGINLNERGRRQAVQLAGALGNAPIKAIYSSPLERTIQTAAPLAAVLGLEVQVETGLLEVDIGKWHGRPLKQLRKLKAWKVLQEQPSAFRFPGGESYLEIQARCVAAMQAVITRHPDDLVACFSHGDILRMLTAHFLEMPLDSFQRLGIDTTSITQVHINKEGKVFVSRFNQVLGFAWPEDWKKEKTRGQKDSEKKS